MSKSEANVLVIVWGWDVRASHYVDFPLCVRMNVFARIYMYVLYVLVYEREAVLVKKFWYKVSYVNTCAIVFVFVYGRYVRIVCEYKLFVYSYGRD